MAVTTVNNTDTLDIQRIKINEISGNLGDVALLDAAIVAEADPNTDVVHALNAGYSLLKNIERSLLIRAITLG